MNNLEKPQLIKRGHLNQAHYFRSILEKAGSLGLLTGSELENIQLQCVELLARQVERYTCGESSSVKIETAQNIMESIFYTIGIYLKSMPSPEMGLTALKQQPLSELHSHGKKLIRANFEGARKLFQAVENSRIPTDNHAYNDTIQNGIPEFFSSYDIDFAAHETPAPIDYPVSNDKMELTGIEYICGYLQKLHLENQFCSNFAKHDLDCLLRGYDDRYQDLLINIFGLALTNAVGCIWADKNTLQLNIEPSDIRYWQQKLANIPKDELESMLQHAATRLMKENKISDVLLQKHITAAVRDLSPKLIDALENNRLESVFVSLREDHTQPLMQFADGEKMDDELFRTIIDEIRQCRFVSDKIAIIQREIHSLTDLIDILEGYCVFDDEFYAIFGSLGDSELALLVKKLPTHIIDSEFHFTENEKEWQSKLDSYFTEIDVSRRKRIRELADKIILD